VLSRRDIGRPFAFRHSEGTRDSCLRLSSFDTGEEGRKVGGGKKFETCKLEDERGALEDGIETGMRRETGTGRRRENDIYKGVDGQ
jgi:hypothetical protein